MEDENRNLNQEVENERREKRKMDTDLANEMRIKQQESKVREGKEKDLRAELVELELRLQIENSGNCTAKLSEARLREEIQRLKGTLRERGIMEEIRTNE